MIIRYSRPAAIDIWSQETKYRIWFEIEAHAATRMAELGVIPTEAAEAIWAKGKDAVFDADRIDEIERTTKHDVIAFLTHVAEIVGDEARFLHQGMTSSDVLDTCFAVQLARSADLLVEGVDRVLAALETRAKEHKFTPCVGRSHGIHAEPTSFGLAWALWYSEMERNRERLVRARDAVSVGKISGAVGAFAHLSPDVEARVCERLGIKAADVSTQVIQRDRYAEYLCTLGIIASTLEKIALQVRHWQRTEVREAQEAFKKGQKGSSAMPHKRNPILSERICGMARTVRANAIVGLENIALWHERDISHSSAERVVLPDASITLHYMLVKFAGLIADLVVDVGPPPPFDLDAELMRRIGYRALRDAQERLRGRSRPRPDGGAQPRLLRHGDRTALPGRVDRFPAVDDVPRHPVAGAEPFPAFAVPRRAGSIDRHWARCYHSRPLPRSARRCRPSRTGRQIPASSTDGINRCSLNIP